MARFTGADGDSPPGACFCDIVSGHCDRIERFPTLKQAHTRSGPIRNRPTSKTDFVACDRRKYLVSTQPNAPAAMRTNIRLGKKTQTHALPLCLAHSRMAGFF